MLSEGVDCIFVHITNTGGTGIVRALGLAPSHATARQWRSAVGARAWEQAFTFGFVRNPWDRVAAHHRHVVNAAGRQGEDLPPFTEWVRRAFVEGDPSLVDRPLRFVPQSRWLVDNDGRVMVDFVGRFERLAEDFLTVCDALGRHATLPPPPRAPERPPYQEVYDQASAEVVAQVFAEDIERFGYRFADG